MRQNYCINQLLHKDCLTKYYSSLEKFLKWKVCSFRTTIETNACALDEVLRENDFKMCNPSSEQ